MMGMALATSDVPIVKATTGIILMSTKAAKSPQPGPCIRCSRCVDQCPMGLMPNDLVRFVERGREADALAYGIRDCIECGVCAYVCPAKIDHVRWMRQGKNAVPGPGSAPRD